MTGDAAIIGLLGAILGIVLSNIFVALLEKRRREERRKDIVCALHAEILAGIGASQRQLSPEERAYALANPTPFQTADQTDFVFESVKADISLLPIEVVHSVVQYYRFAMQTNLMILDFRDPTFKEQTPDEKRKFVASILDVADLQSRGGARALGDLEAFAAGVGLNLTEKRRMSDAVTQSGVVAAGNLKQSGGSDLT